MTTCFLHRRVPASAATAATAASAATTTAAATASAAAAAAATTAATAITAAATTVAAAAAAITTAATAAAAALITRSGFAGSGFVDGQASTIDFCVVLGVDSVVHLVRVNIDEAETSTFDDAGVGAAEFCEDSFESRLRCRVGQVPYIE